MPHEEVVEWVCNIGKSVGTIIVIKKSNFGQGTGGVRITFGCERGGRYKEPNRNANKEKEP